MLFCVGLFFLNVYPDKSPVDLSDYPALKANILGMRISHYVSDRNWDMVGKIADEREEVLRQAEQANPDNPMVWMLKGIGLLRRAETREEGKKVLATAIEKYEQFPPASPIHPWWGRQLIDFWLAQYDDEAPQLINAKYQM